MKNNKAESDLTREIATARRMLASGKYGMEEISDISGLTVQDIQALSANP